MFDFIKWRGDLSLTVSPFCEVDALIFSQLSYLHFRDALAGKTMRLRDAAVRVFLRHPQGQRAPAAAEFQNILTVG